MASSDNIDFGEHGYAYSLDLCRAIEAYVDDCGRENGGYDWRGMRLAPAVERYLYIHGVNSPALFGMWCHSKGIAARMVAPSSAVDFALMDAIVGDGRTSRSIPSLAMHLAKEVPRRLYTRMRMPVGQGGARARADVSPRVLVNVINPKFANFLRPIADRFQIGEIGFLAFEGDALKGQLQSGGYDVVSADRAPDEFRDLLVPAGLRPWPSIVNLAKSIHSALIIHRPEVVLVVEGNSPSDIATSEACRTLGIPCYCVQQGWSPIVHSGFRGMSFTGMFVWGDAFSEILQPFNPDQVFMVSGSHSVGRQKPASREARRVSFFLQAPCALLGYEGYAAFAMLAADIAENHPELEVVVRPHPGYALPASVAARYATSHRLRISDPTQETLSDLLLRSDVAVSVFSTVLLEALSMGVVPLICSIGGMKKYYPDIAGMGAGIEVFSIEEAEAAIVKLRRNPEVFLSSRRKSQQTSIKFFADLDAVEFIHDRLVDASD
jgi:hypothetical protein